MAVVSAAAMARGAALLKRVQIVVSYAAHCRREYELERRMAERMRRTVEWSNSPATQPELSVTSAPRFEIDDQLAWKLYLEEHGFAIVKGVANDDEISQARGLLWDFFEASALMQRVAPSSWTNENFMKVGDPTTGIVSGSGFGQAEVCWFVRTLPSVRQAFARIWGTEDLITSFDGGCVFRPFHAPGAEGQRSRGGWWHVDQGRSKRGLHAVQGLVLLTDASLQTGGLCVVPGSHKLHADLMSYTTAPDGQDFVAVPAPQVNPSLRQGTLLAARAGDLLLWDSRTMHCNTPALQPPSAALGQPVDELLRAAVYVCKTPRRRASHEVLLQRRRAAVMGIGTTHWPHEFKPTASDECLKGVSEAELEEALRKLSPKRRALIG